MNLEEIFCQKLTENGDTAFSKASTNPLVNLLFMSEYYQKHLNEVPNIGTDVTAQLFAMFMRDPRAGLGRRDLGRKLMANARCSIEQIVKAGRVDDLFNIERPTLDSLNVFLNEVFDWCKKEIENGNELVKKWMPRYSSKNLMLAREIAKYWGMNKQQYGHFVKCNTIEYKLSCKKFEEIMFEHVPSLASIKYARCFNTRPELKERYQQYLEDVKVGKKELHVSTTTVYDIFKNRNIIDPDIFFDKLEKISGSWLPIVDTSGSMWDCNDSIGKALSVAHYLAKCSSYAPNKVISFSSHPQLLTLGQEPDLSVAGSWDLKRINTELIGNSQYMKEICSMYTGDCSNTNFGAVMDLLKDLDDVPEYLIVLSDMEFDSGSRTSKQATMDLFKSKGYKTRIIWWNFNSRNTTAPEMDTDGNIFISGYSPYLLKFLESGFDANAFLEKLLKEYLSYLQKK